MIKKIKSIPVRANTKRGKACGQACGGSKCGKACGRCRGD